jgi:hypothetical protein
MHPSHLNPHSSPSISPSVPTRQWMWDTALTEFVQRHFNDDNTTTRLLTAVVVVTEFRFFKILPYFCEFIPINVFDFDQGKWQLFKSLFRFRRTCNVHLSYVVKKNTIDVANKVYLYQYMPLNQANCHTTACCSACMHIVYTSPGMSILWDLLHYSQQLNSVCAKCNAPDRWCCDDSWHEVTFVHLWFSTHTEWVGCVGHLDLVRFYVGYIPHMAFIME